MKQTIDISPQNVAPVAAAGIKFLNLETTLIPGNIKQQLAVLEVYLSGLAAGELLLATPAPLPVESDAKTDDTGDGDDPTKRPPTLKEIREMTNSPDEQTGAGEGQSG